MPIAGRLNHVLLTVRPGSSVPNGETIRPVVTRPSSDTVLTRGPKVGGLNYITDKGQHAVLKKTSEKLVVRTVSQVLSAPDRSYLGRSDGRLACRCALTRFSPSFVMLWFP